MPAAIALRLAEERRRAALRVLALQAELARLAAGLRDSGVEVLALKGPAFAALIHGRTCRRMSRDLDLLVRPPAEAEALAALAGLGWRLAAESLEDGPEHHHRILRHPQRPFAVELHTRLASDDRLFPRAALAPFDSAVEVTVAGQPVRTPGMEAALVYAGWHASRHFWRRLFWLTDITAAARSGNVDWAATLTLARRVGVERHLALALVLAHDLTDLALPHPVAGDAALSAAARRAARALEPLLARPILATDAEAWRCFGPVRFVAWDLRLLGRSDALRAAIGKYGRPSAADRRLARLPERLEFLYYLVRAFRIPLHAVVRWMGEKSR